MVGTLEYMAPEVLLKAPGSFASDVYAFAVAVNEIASGVFPFSDCTRDNPKAHTILDMGYGRCGPRTNLLCPQFVLPPPPPPPSLVFLPSMSRLFRTSSTSVDVGPLKITQHWLLFNNTCQSHLHSSAVTLLVRSCQGH